MLENLLDLKILKIILERLQLVFTMLDGWHFNKPLMHRLASVSQILVPVQWPSLRQPKIQSYHFSSNLNCELMLKYKVIHKWCHQFWSPKGGMAYCKRLQQDDMQNHQGWSETQKMLRIVLSQHITIDWWQMSHSKLFYGSSNHASWILRFLHGTPSIYLG